MVVDHVEVADNNNYLYSYLLKIYKQSYTSKLHLVGRKSSSYTHILAVYRQISQQLHSLCMRLL